MKACTAFAKIVKLDLENTVLIYTIGSRNQVSKYQALKNIICFAVQSTQKSFDMYLLGGLDLERYINGEL